MDGVTSTAAALMAGKCRFFNLFEVRDHIGSERCHHVSRNGLTSTLNDHADLS